MRLPPRQSAEADLMGPFQLAALKTIGDEDKHFHRVSLRMPSAGSTAKNSLFGLPKSKTLVDEWHEIIALEYSVKWPLQLIFTQEALSKYRRVFQYLLRLKRTQMELEKSWGNVSHTDFTKLRNERKKNSASKQRGQYVMPMWCVREHMAFLIRNLQFYIQVDVIESQWNVLQSHIQESRDFTELVKFHQEYLSALISQSFLDIRAVTKILVDIMNLCLQFCWKIENEENPCSSGLDDIVEIFQDRSNALYTVLHSKTLADSQVGPFVRRFLLRLNYNSFFQKTAMVKINDDAHRFQIG